MVTVALSRFLGRIEGFDISHTAGQDAVASQVVFQHGKPSKKHYRKYAIRSADVRLGHSDDYESIREVIRRRFAGYVDVPDDVSDARGDVAVSSVEGSTSRGKQKPKKRRKPNSQPLPDLVMIDGGKGQLSAAMEALAECGLTPEVGQAEGTTDSDASDASDAKLRGSTTTSSSSSSSSSSSKSAATNNGVWYKGRCMAVVALAKREEEVFVPGHGAALESLRNPASPALLLLRQVRDEAHRFALTYHRKRRSASAMRTKVPGAAEPAAATARSASAGAAESGGVGPATPGPDFALGDGVYGLRDDDPDLVALGKVKGLSLPKRRALLVELGSLSRVAEATEAELRAVSGIGPTLAARVIAHFASSQPSPLPSWEVVELEK